MKFRRRRPTLARHPTSRSTARRSSPPQLFGAARHCLDYDFITRNPDFRQLVAYVDTGDADWLDFDLTPAEKKDLFVRGVEAAGAFLTRFDWPAYKRTRKAIAEAYVAAARSEGGT